MFKTLSQKSAVRTLLLASSTLLAEFEPGTSVAMLLSRPGRGRANAEDRRWNQVLTGAARKSSAELEPTFLANDQAVQAL